MLKFVSDAPPQALVDRLAATYLASDTAIAPVLRELVRSAEFRGSRGGKLRDPAEDLVATYRSLGVRFTRPSGDEDGANAIFRSGISGFPTTTKLSSNYWVDVVFDQNGTDTVGPSVVSTRPDDASQSAPISAEASTSAVG